MRRLMLLGWVLALGACAGTPTNGEEQGLVDRATLSVQEILGNGNDQLDAASLLRRARAVMVCPRVFRAGFFFGGQGGGCVMVGRDGGGSWSSPAFYSLGAGSFGLQAGIQDSEILLLIMNDRALNAVLDSQFKFGADASLAVVTLGGSIEGATTAAAGADIVAYARSRGLYAGLTLNGTLLSARSEWNRGYYRRDVGPRDIVVGAAAHNPGADPLRAVLLRYGTAGGLAAGQVPPGGPGGAPSTTFGPRGDGPATGGGAGRVQSERLPPLRR